MGVQVTFPDELLVAARQDREQFARRVIIYTLGRMIQQGEISSGLGARILGCDRWEFYRLLSEHGFAVIDYAADEREQEAQTSRQIAERLKQL